MINYILYPLAFIGLVNVVFLLLSFKVRAWIYTKTVKYYKTKNTW